MKAVIHDRAISRLRFTDEVQDQVHEIAKDVMWAAYRRAPVRTGHYIISFYSRQVGGVNPHSVVGAHDFKAWWIEFGTIRMRAQAPLRKALASQGLKFISTK